MNQDDLRISFQGLHLHAKQVRESENIEVEKESVKMPSMGKSVSQTDLNFPPPPEKGELLRMKS